MSSEKIEKERKSKNGNQKDIRKEAHEWAMNKIEEINLSDKEDLKELQARLYKIIDYSINRFDWFEDQRHKLLQIGLSLLTFASALSIIFAGVYTRLAQLSFTYGLISIASLLFTGLFLVLYYNDLITPNYPHRKFADIISWFFIYNIDDKIPSSLSPYEAKAEKQVESVIKNYKKFIDKWIDFATQKNRFLLEDLEQIFIIHVLKSYRLRSITIMKQILVMGVFTFIVFFMASIFSFILQI